MDASMATFQARLATFQGAPAAKTRRPSSRSKKAAPKAKAAWPLAAPSAEDLAFAGFVWRPTSVSPDNVQCWACNCQLDGWEEADVPAYEHLTHSPSCGFAVVTTIRLRHGDPGRTEEDPISERMIAARKETFGDLWPLDVSAGYPSVDQLAEAGWFYDPTEETPDGATCAYCHLSLDAWDAGDDPLEEHRRRASDCLFFALSELYHPVAPEPKKAKRVTKGKRASSRSSIASNATSTTAPQKKATRGKTRASEAIDDTQMSDTTAPKKKATRGRKRASEAVDETQMSETVAPKKKATRGKKAATESMDDTQMSEATTRGTRGRKPASEAIDDTQLSKATTRGRKRASEAIDDTHLSKATTRGKKRISEATDDSELPKAKPRGKKRTSEAIEDDMQMSDIHHGPPKRMRFSSMSSFPDDLDVGTPKNQPTTETVTEPFTMSSLPGSVLAGTPKRTPAHMKEAAVTKTPSRKQVEDDENNGWKPTDMDAFFGNQEEVEGFFNGVLVDAGLDELTATGTTPKQIQAAVLAALTDEEKAMTIEQWVMYNAQRGEEKLRKACEQQIAAFRAEGKRALAQLQAIPTY
ncbi:hypothetical protein HBH92_151160 [Parastagonospora nodorum]|nr:hypothetical protein HBH49_069290 [Parastagonospora nodorum]KAH4175739.1 hypothetical protein HBH43_066310 [Parastagonospora nodorum]KAH4407991.1 hypothetical protein HBH92_151160 [Parastagonospora nodorum]KAH4442454.1 hypothetical protein HBH93_075170 [Parastagonospora nodorum]KAH4453718.1 hypothetical protein HBH91_103390 [Parastagonospora nodorum]